MMAMMKKAVKARLLKYSPASDLELPPKPPKKKFQMPSPDDWKKLIEYSKSPFIFGAGLSSLNMSQVPDWGNCLL
ncbi:hypothetical protein [Selenomonas sp. AE3005]|uniref:hypothetical protein n=1 Tax=Selenomonas sp. AE3005 TaxID=1485543 RepID=UPI0025D92CC2|nr:hypothetical protein [Selenomonas sp. AE3005]